MESVTEKVAFIVVNYNTEKLLADLLSFLEATDFPFSCKVIVVDNASSDRSTDLLENKKNITVIRNKENIGYARAVNQGVRLATSKYICVLNTDLILNNSAMNDIWTFMENNDSVGVSTPVICYPNNKIQGFISKINVAILYADFIGKAYSKFIKMVIATSKSPVKVDGVMGAFLFLRSSIIDDKKLFDEDFFFYYEDADLAWRLKKRDVTVMVLPASRIIHLGGGSSNIKPARLFYESKYLYIRKHYGRRHLKIIYMMDLFQARRKLIIYRILSLLYPTERIKSKLRYYHDLSGNFDRLKIVD